MDAIIISLVGWHPGVREGNQETNPMAKGHKCPNCGKNTLQPYTTNQLKCSDCGTIVKK